MPVPADETSLPTADQLRIQSLIHRYATAIDTRDWPLLESCFTPELVADFGAIGRWHGREAFVRHMEEGHQRYGPTLHRISNIVLAPGKDGALSATSYVDAVLMPLTADGLVRQACGRYRDEIIAIDGIWKIRSRRFEQVLVFDRPLPA